MLSARLKPCTIVPRLAKTNPHPLHTRVQSGTRVPTPTRAQAGVIAIALGESLRILLAIGLIAGAVLL